MPASVSSVAWEREGQHPVVDLQHEDRPRQHQQVHEHAEEADGKEQAAAFRQRRADLAAGDHGRGFPPPPEDGRDA